jgi:hypothetical protein
MVLNTQSTAAVIFLFSSALALSSAAFSAALSAAKSAADLDSIGFELLVGEDEAFFAAASAAALSKAAF